MKWAIGPALLLLAAATPARAAPLKWTASGTTLIASDGTVQYRATAGAISGESDDTFQLLAVEAEADFDGDGSMDAVVSLSTGGNCCPSEIFFVTLKAGKVVPAHIAESWADDAAVGVASGKPTLGLTDSTGAKGVWTFDGNKAVVASAATRHVLVASVEVHGAGQALTDPGAKSFQADLDADGAPETVSCKGWERWGTLLCTLPLADGKVQELSMGCDRFGVLKSMSNGRHDLVCDDDIVLKFDGHTWVEAASASKP